MKKSVYILIAILLSVSAMVLSAGAEEKSAAAVFVTSKCSVCHKIEKVCGQIGAKNADQWATTIKRMAEKRAGISEADQKQIADFLSKATDKKELCTD